MDKFLEAVNFAIVAHDGQRRKDKFAHPFIVHPIDVARILSKAGITDSDILIGAVLHDSIEDTKVTYEDIVEKFGQEVADYVQEVSDNKSLSKLERKKLQIEHAKEISNGAKLIKLADKISNLTSLTISVPENWPSIWVTGYFAWAKQCTDNMRGISGQLDNQLDELYATTLIDMDISKVLEEYYASIAPVNKLR